MALSIKCDSLALRTESLIRHLLVTMFKVFNNNRPTYLRERFHRTSEFHNYNLRGSNYDLQLPLPYTNFLQRSFSYRGAMA